MNRLHNCEHEGCEKKTRMRCCAEHLPRCTKCGAKCKMFDNRENAKCWKHTAETREKTRLKIAGYRALKRARNAARYELSTIAQPHIDGLEHYYRGLLGDREFIWQEFVVWMRMYYPLAYNLFDQLGCACVRIDTVSAEDLDVYIAEMREELTRYVDEINKVGA